jgi:heat shock protein HtpX
VSDIAINFFRQRQHAFLNLVHTWLLIAGSLALFIVCAWIFFGPDGILYAVVFGGISLFMASRISPKLVLRMYKARPASRAAFPIGHQILDQLTERAELEARPELYIVPSRMMNAFAVGRRDDSALAMTDKLVRSLTVRELAGVMAHEVAHIRNQDIRVMAVADMVSRFTSMLSTFGMIALFANLPMILAGGGAPFPWLGILLLMSAPTVGSLLQLALSRTREYDADLGAVMLTGDPDGLASALAKLERVQQANWEGMVLPGGRVPNPSVLRSHPKTEDRIERLMALKKDRVAGEPEASAPFRKKPAEPRRSSPVPKIKHKWGRGEEAKYSDYASLLGTNPPAPLHGEDDADRPASERELNPADGRPRIRITRGGVWW